MLGNFSKAIEVCSRFLHFLGSYMLIPLLTALIGLDVTLRYIFNSPLAWGAEVSALMLLVVLFSGLVHTTRKHGHVRMDMFYRRMSPAARRASDGLSGFCGMITAGFLCVQSLMSTIEAYRWEEGAEMIELPYWPFTAFMFLCSLILFFQFLMQMFHAAMDSSDKDGT
jgi:TRAP-type C4-dicarboxylate transport system permease small subunit